MQLTVLRRRLNEYTAAALSTFFIALLALPAPARAEGRIRIADQYGIVYLLLNVARDQHLIEKQGKAEGLNIQVDWMKLSGGAAVNEAVLSGAVDIGAAGVGPLLTLWDKTYGRQNVKGIASLGDFPFDLVSIDPKVKTIADFTDHDRIALPAVTVSMQSRVLQMAAAKLWGIKQYDKLDPLTVTLPHPEQAADTYIRVNKSKIDRNLLLRLISSPQVRFTLEPQNTFALARFMSRAGAIRHKPRSWKDYFFSSAATAQGS